MYYLYLVSRFLPFADLNDPDDLYLLSALVEAGVFYSTQKRAA